MPEYEDMKHSTGKRPERWAMDKDFQNDEYGTWHCERGNVTTPFGIVHISTSQYYNKRKKSANGSSRLNFVYDGKDYTREFKKNYRPRYLVTLAMVFAKEITEKEGR